MAIKIIITLGIGIVICFSPIFLMAEEEKLLVTEEAKDVITPMVELIAESNNAYTDDASGELLYNNLVFRQAATVAIVKGKTGLYFQVENLTPASEYFLPHEDEAGVLEGIEPDVPITDLYVYLATECNSVKFTAGYVYYWVRSLDHQDYHSVYTLAECTLPRCNVVPFVGAEYRMTQEGENEHGIPTFLDGLVYVFGVKRECQLHERVTVTPQFVIGGHAGIYGEPAEYLSFTREQADVAVMLEEWLIIKCSAMLQQNIGRKNGIAMYTDDRLFVSASVSLSF